MSLRAQLDDLLGPEVQAHPISIGGRSKTLHFRQFTDAVGQRIFALAEGETVEARGRRIMVSVIAESACDEAGQLISSPAEVEALPSAALAALYEKAALTNNIVSPAKPGGDDAEAGDEGAAPKL